ncbi:MAG: flagellar hook-associated protein FlgL [Clostridium beijerinckii]|uniref:flagellar hook-associated protein FlgL n=1 Tax=Clostridium beijerinckii TaxID=1520 RepID=UPI001494F547|nr:flagellar hook-associated protein FlgL [Clostridium beijerinckii]MCI1477740.1 flagellar hook-associated protein FlgL [Clostridium beijerinckii]MCI1577944.1 flagellar hook-associated protein FlgL [Clostridium beijerinckii]MCI1583125.1 flagellar hook-associated protein FlgL [Clostridium beijerinckii]MCI1620645.1 flagellar hook-associated protein FlgL [Clostridium beijerinckii]NOW87882.1 flagellar hook-associated protein 3 FlgL [Clostridium beijerinckii]
MPRITSSMLVANYMNNMKRNLGNMSVLQNQLSSGNLINRASDNPYTATRIMQLNTEIAANKQYNSNINDTSNWLDSTDTALSQAGNVFSRIRELMVKAGNGAYGPNEISTIKDEVVEKVKELGQVLNSSFDGNYIFGGTKSTSKPITVDGNGNINYADKNGAPLTTDGTTTNTLMSNIKSTDDEYKQIGTGLKAEIATGVVVDYNKTAKDILEFKDSDTGTPVYVPELLTDIIKNLNDASGSDPIVAKAAISNLTGTNLTQLDSSTKNLLQCRASVGAMQNRMDSAANNNEDQTYNMTSILSESSDIDFTQKTMEYSVAQTVYTASLQTSAKVLSRTLLDYL